MPVAQLSAVNPAWTAMDKITRPRAIGEVDVYIDLWLPGVVSFASRGVICSEVQVALQSRAIEEGLIRSLQNLQQKARARGANCVIGLEIECELVPEGVCVRMTGAAHEMEFEAAA
jgi:hypothetical protein